MCFCRLKQISRFDHLTSWAGPLPPSLPLGLCQVWEPTHPLPLGVLFPQRRLMRDFTTSWSWGGRQLVILTPSLPFYYKPSFSTTTRKRNVVAERLIEDCDTWSQTAQTLKGSMNKTFWDLGKLYYLGKKWRMPVTKRSFIVLTLAAANQGRGNYIEARGGARAAWREGWQAAKAAGTRQENK